MGKTFNSYIDEGGDFSIGNDPLDLLIISIVLAPQFEDQELQQKLSTLEHKLTKSGYSGIIHTAPLVRKSNEYAQFELQQRREIFWSLYNFAQSANIATKTFIFEKHNINNQPSIHDQTRQTITDFLDSIPANLHIFYDGGQRPLMEILYSYTENRFSTENYHADFDHTTNRAFQVADLMTYVYRLVYKIQHNLPLTKSDKLFFSKDNLRRFVKDATNNTEFHLPD